MGKQVAITDTYLNSVFKLNNQDRKLAFNTAKQLAENPEAPSLHTHSIDREKCDKKFLSARINLDLRMIFVRRGDVCTLLYVDHHDAAYDWCEGKYLVKTNFGTEYIYDEKLAVDKIDSFHKKPVVPDYLNFSKKTPLFEAASVKQKNLEKLGVQEIHAENLMKIETEEELLEYIEIFPEELQEALIDLATQVKPFDMVYNELFCADEAEKSINEIRRFYLTEDMDELEKLMENEEFEKWTLFLHPSQDKLVSMNCSGPMLIEGGPGTGKTIVGIHRAVRLAKDTYKAEDNKRILFCTFSKKLSRSIMGKINRLCEIKNVQCNIDVMSVDSYIAKMLGRSACNVDMRRLDFILRFAYQGKVWNYSLEFLIQEYYEVIERLHIQNLEDYLKADRTGAGTALSRRARMEIWPYFEKVITQKHEQNVFSFVDRAYQLWESMASGRIRPIYDSVIIDEAQDLESIKLKVICSSVKNTKNAACILSDKNQRIFRLNTWSSDAGVNIVGRSFYLRVNYRTTKQINEYARHQFLKFDNSNPSEREYISIMSGEEPEIIRCDSESKENHIIVDRVKKYLNLYPADEICILAPTYEKLNSVKSIFEYEGMQTFMLSGDEIPIRDGKIKFCTTSGVKGLEFSIVVIAAFDHMGTQRQNYGCAPEAALNYEKLVECEKYVALTRARDKVLITYVGAKDGISS